MDLEFEVVTDCSPRAVLAEAPLLESVTQHLLPAFQSVAVLELMVEAVLTLLANLVALGHQLSVELCAASIYTGL